MSSAKNVVTVQQLNGFGMRNLSVRYTSNTTLMDVYFKLVVDRRVVYVSEIVKNTLNPVWLPLEMEEKWQSHLTSFGGGLRFDIFVYRILNEPSISSPEKQVGGGGEASTPPKNHQQHLRLSAERDLLHSNCLIIEEEEEEEGNTGLLLRKHDHLPEQEEEIFHFPVNCRDLELLPIQADDIATLPYNTCLYEFNGKTYIKKIILDTLIENGMIQTGPNGMLGMLGKSKRKGSILQMKEYTLSKGVSNLEKIISLRKKMDGIRRRNGHLKKTIETKLDQEEKEQNKQIQRKILEEKIQKLQLQVMNQRDTLYRMKQVTEEEKQFLETDLHLPKALLSTMQMSMQYKDEKQSILERRKEVLRAAHRIRARQAVLVKQLESVYPIEYIGAGEYSIRGIKVSNADLASTKDDEMVSTALGYIAHLGFMLSKYLQVNLRYRIIPFSSKSFLKDEINDPNGEYPLYKKGAERDRYEKAILFLRKNVEQLLFSRGLDPTQGAPILARLKALTDAEATWLLTDRDVSTTVAASITTSSSSLEPLPPFSTSATVGSGPTSTINTTKTTSTPVNLSDEAVVKNST